jgi:hypothetical protein
MNRETREWCQANTSYDFKIVCMLLDVMSCDRKLATRLKSGSETTYKGMREGSMAFKKHLPCQRNGKPFDVRQSYGQVRAEQPSSKHNVKEVIAPWGLELPSLGPKAFT